MTAVSVFGLGYVGCVSAACLAKGGHSVTGVDLNPGKVDLINRGKPTILEEGIGDLVAAMQATGRLRATTDTREAVLASSLSLIAVGTPSQANASLDLRQVERVCEEIGRALRDKPEFHVVVVRSTVLPGTIDDLVVPALERASGKRRGEGFEVCSNPEFLREGTSIKDYYDPPFTLIGSASPAAADAVRALYAGIEAPVFVVAVRVAEMVKYVCNCFHGLKVGFANEIGHLCKAQGIDSHEVMRIVCEDRKLNISPAYLRPGYAFGGSCLPKDIRAAIYRAQQLDVEVPILRATLESNRKQVERAFQMVLAAGNRRVGVLGLSFKAGTDDLRESPLVSLIELLIGRGMELLIFDRNVTESNTMGANREYVEREIPHIWTLMRPRVEDVVSASDTIVVGNASPELAGVREGLRPGQVLIDLARAFGPAVSNGTDYQGIAW